MIAQVKPVEIVMYPDGRMDTRNAVAHSRLSEKTLATLRCEEKGTH